MLQAVYTIHVCLISIDLRKAGRPRQNVSFAKDLPSRKRRHTSDESLKKTRKKKVGQNTGNKISGVQEVLVAFLQKCIVTKRDYHISFHLKKYLDQSNNNDN